VGTAARLAPIWFKPVQRENVKKRKREVEANEEDSEQQEETEDDSSEDDSDDESPMEEGSDTEDGEETEDESDGEDDESDDTLQKKHQDSRRACVKLGRSRALPKPAKKPVQNDGEDDGYVAELKDEYSPKPLKKKLWGPGRRPYSSLARR
jgi:hypothetical protein